MGCVVVLDVDEILAVWAVYPEDLSWDACAVYTLYHLWDWEPSLNPTLLDRLENGFIKEIIDVVRKSRIWHGCGHRRENRT
jgi:hypothetical protein